MNNKEYAKFFRFNLIPPKSKEELMVLEERDNSIVYSLFLIFSAVFIFFALNLIEAIAIRPQILEAEQDLTNLQNKILQNDPIVKSNGELILKSNLLKPVINDDIKVAEIIDVSNEIAVNGDIMTYIREQTGEIVLTIKISNVGNVTNIIKSAQENEKIEDVFLRSVTIQQGSVPEIFNMTMSFRIKT